MKKLVLLGVAISLFACQQEEEKIDTSIPSELATELDSVSYLIGMYVGSDMKQKGMTAIQKTSFLTGIQRSLEGLESEISPEIASTFMNAYFNKLQQEKLNKSNQQADSFLNENKSKPGVNVTASGLQYKVLTAGDGELPTAEDTIVVHYTGKLIDGTVFGSSIKRGEPIKVQTSSEIKGWGEALLMMPKGSTWELVIPASLGFGDRDMGPIPSNSVLIYEVNIVDIIH
ncbi:FKBP-type peptidyl-prolyl cis-trans isomerase [Bacteroidia bacterium]|nr:FKBP-type peptidyl-prolyl cis-trans isomerase [Bacteroidia bacterium]